jgi:hypothetical protein
LPTAPALAAFPRPLADYVGEEGLSLGAVLLHRAQEEPLNLVATLLFLGAIVHTFAAPWIATLAHRLQHRQAVDRNHDGTVTPDEGPLAAASFRVEILHFLGEVEVVFGLWVIPLLAVISLAKGWQVADHFLGHGVHFTEPMFVVVIMAMASTRPVLELAERAIGKAANFGGGSPAAWWLAILTLGPLLGSFITEPAAMVISALLLSRRFYDLKPSKTLAYGTLGLLFVNISVGGTLTHFAAPPVLMVAGQWGWGFSFMLRHFGLAAVVGILAANLIYGLAFRRELIALGERDRPHRRAERRRSPWWVVATHCAFLAWTVLTAHSPVMFVGGFLFFLAFLQASEPHQDPLSLRSPLLVGFFLAGLVVHGTLQQWWLAPVLGQLGELPLFFGSAALTAFNDNAAITYLASLVPSLTDGMKIAVVAGAVTGGGLTVIANAPNPAGQALLTKYFAGGISPLGLLAGAMPPTLVMAVAFLASR